MKSLIHALQSKNFPVIFFIILLNCQSQRVLAQFNSSDKNADFYTTFISEKDTGNEAKSVSVSPGFNSAIAEIFALSPPLISVVVNTTDASCEGNDGTFTLTVTGGAPPFTFLLTNINDITTENTTGVFTGLSGGYYTYQVKDSSNSIIASGGRTVEQVQVFTVAVTVSNVTCNAGSNGSINLTVTGGQGPFTYQWSNGSTTRDLTAINAGTYIVVIKDATGCQTSSEINITEPPAVLISVDVTGISCYGKSDGLIGITATGGTSPYKYLLNGVKNNTGKFTSLGKGNYTCTVIDGNNCSVTKMVTVNQPPLLSASVTTKAASCSGSDGAVTISATGGRAPYIFVLNGKSNNTGIFSELNAGNYHYTVTAAGGCSVEGTASVKGALPISVNISVSGEVFKIWNNYIMFISNFNPSPWARLTANAHGGGDYTYQWGNGEKTASILVKPKKPSSYVVVVTDKNGCKAVSNIIIFVIDLRFGGFGLPGVTTSALNGISKAEFPGNAYNKKLFKLYPNPAGNYITLENFTIKEQSNTEITILNTRGQMVLKKKVTGSINR